MRRHIYVATILRAIFIIRKCAIIRNLSLQNGRSYRKYHKNCFAPSSAL